MSQTRKALLTHLFLSMLLLFSSSIYASPQVKHIKVEGGNMAYFHIGKGMPVLLLHGLFANKTQWLEFVKVLEKQQAPYAFIIPDLPGFGDSQGFPMTIYNANAQSNPNLNQVRVLHAFITALKLNTPVAIAGNSLGGLIAASYAQAYPNEVSALAFIGSPLGAAPPTPLYYKLLAQGYNPFIPFTPAQFLAEMKLLMINVKAHLPSKAAMMQRLALNKTKAARLSLIYTMLMTYPNIQALMHPIPEIQAPILIFWGEEDHLFGDTKQAYALSQQFPKSAFKQVIPLAHAGHVIMLEDNQVLSKASTDFLAFLKAAHEKVSVQFA